jgi:L-seryl-tRNA(Ser) seleniumtransferase
VTDISGRWRLTLYFVAGTGEHMLDFTQDAGMLAGTHTSPFATSPLDGSIEGAAVHFSSSRRIEATPIVYTFTGSIDGIRMSGNADLGEFGRASWSAVRSST